MQELINEIENLKKRVEELEIRSSRLPDVHNLRSKFDDLVKNTCQAFSVTEEEFFSKGRCRRISNARHLVSYIAVNHMAMSVKDVGRRIKKDHSTVIHSRNEYQNYLDMKWPEETRYYNTVINSLMK